MLSLLHSKINNIAEILSIEEVSANNYIIQYKDPDSISSQQITQINNILSNWPLDLAKTQKIKLLDENWNNLVKQGFTTQYGWKLGLQNSDVTLLTGAFLLAKEASSLGISDTAIIVDTDNMSHAVSITDLTVMMLQYGQYRTNLSTEYSNKKNTIEQSSSIEQLDNIII